MALLAIKGHETRGNEVIEILEMLGGKNKQGYNGENNFLWHYINEHGDINIFTHVVDLTDFIFFTLKEFLEKFPYKVGDKVNYVKYNDEYPSVYTIQRMRWTGVTIEYLLDSSGFSALTKDLQPYKEETMEEIKIEIPAGYEFAGVDDNAQQVVFTKIQPQYPKTYKECCELLSLGEDGRLYTKGYKASLIQDFQKLLICRDAYWKIAGEQMGLDKPWEPDWTNTNSNKYCIYYVGDEIKKQPMLEVHHFLAFPTAEMRDAFKENFDDDIEFCKEFL